MSRLATVFCRSASGMQAPLVRVEVHIAGGLPGMTIVGLPETAVREARDRVRAALQSSGFTVPASRITINLAPADLPKQGSRFDLAIALGVLQASGLLELELDECEFLAELGLDGSVRPVCGVLPVARAAAAAGRRLVLASTAAAEAALVDGLRLGPADTLLGVCAALSAQADWASVPVFRAQAPPPRADLAEVRGQAQACRALEIAASGGHNLLFYGPPGSGKSMLAERLPGLLPPLTEAQALEQASIQSLTGEGFCLERYGQRPFRTPHHSASAVALVGGGSQPRPGEISLATHGVLCLDEMAEFPRHVLEVLREPMERGVVRISRAARQVVFPARFQLVATMNPCPCAFLGDPQRECRCTAEQVQRYRARISGPLLDRIDMHLEVCRPPAGAILDEQPHNESTQDVAPRVARAQQRMLGRQGVLNAGLSGAALQEHARLSPALRSLLQQVAERFALSARGMHRVLRVARSIADLAGAEQIAQAHLLEALNYRQFERSLSGTSALYSV